MNFKSHKPYTLANNAYLFLLFSELPSNAFINKGRCGNGGSTLEITNKSRSSILSVPNVTIVLDKKKSHPEVLAVYDQTTIEDIMKFLSNRSKGQKIISTPEGIGKIMKAAKRNKMTEEIYNEWFLLLDEGHSFITEDYRPAILTPFDHFFKFKSKSVISATPYFFSDPRMNQLDYIDVKITGSLGTIKMVESISVKATLMALIDQFKQADSKLFIFYNSVTEIVNLIKACNLSDCNVYCSNDKDGKNKAKLGDYQHMMKDRPRTGEYSQINFLTTTAYEGWDLIGEANATLVAATDIYKPNTLVGINKCFQAFGRLRRTDEDQEHPTFYHIFNHRRIETYKPIEVFKEIFTNEAERILTDHNIGFAKSEESGIKYSRDSRLKSYCRNPLADKPTIHTYLLDQVINHEHSIEVYNHINFITNAWKEYNYEVEHFKSERRCPSNRVTNRISRANQLKADYNALLNIKEDKSFFTISNEMDRIKDRSPLADKAIKYLSPEEMNALNYNYIKVNQIIIQREDSSNSTKVVRLIDTYFKRGSRYTKEHIKCTLQSIYDDLSLRTPSGTNRKATAKHIEQFFEVKECKIVSKSGKSENGFELIRPTFSMVTAN